MNTTIAGEALELAKEGIEIHNPTDPEYKVCKALLDMHAALQAKQAAPSGLREVIPDGCWVVVDQNDRGRLCSLRLMASHTTGGRGEALAQNLEPMFANALAKYINQALATPEQQATPVEVDPEDLTIADYEECLADHRRLVRELDVALNGEEGAAKQASLYDIVGQVKDSRWVLVRAEVSGDAADPILAEAQALMHSLEHDPRDGVTKATLSGLTSTRFARWIVQHAVALQAAELRGARKMREAKPVAWIHKHGALLTNECTATFTNPADWTPLYALDPAAVVKGGA